MYMLFEMKNYNNKSFYIGKRSYVHWKKDTNRK